MKLLKAEQIRKVDLCTMKSEPVASIDLMERAAAACFLWIRRHFPLSTVFEVVCGTGNNGGDGLALSRMLLAAGYKTRTFVVRLSKKASADFSINLERLQRVPGAWVIEITGKKNLASIETDAVVIDALFGTGISRAVSGLSAEVIRWINRSGREVVAIDLPSGLYCDAATPSGSVVVRATHTLTFEVPKQSFFFSAAVEYLGSWSVLEIGWDAACLAREKTSRHYLVESEVRPLIKDRKKFSHKGNFGHGLLFAGSKGKMGAAVLASRAFIRSGGGLLTVHAPECGVSILQTAVPEAMVRSDVHADCISRAMPLEHWNAIGAGPGIGTSMMTQLAVAELLKHARVPMVLDADALNCISLMGLKKVRIPPGTILTPHPGEFERLTKKAKDDWEQLDLLIAFARKHKCYVLLKGAYSRIAFPDGHVYFNSTGNPGMAKGGSGDVLTGILTGLLAQGYSPGDALLLGVYLHGLAGDIAAESMSEFAMSPSDTIDSLGAAYRSLTE